MPKTKDILQLSGKPKAELIKVAIELRENLRSLHEQLWNGKLKGVHQIKKVRKDIARIETFLTRTAS